jgi:hypothetical protein
MADAPLTISMLAGLEVEAEGALSGAARSELMANLQKHAQELGTLSGQQVGERLFKFVAESLRQPLAKVLGELWKQRKELRDAAAKPGPGKDVEGEIELIKHTMTWKVHPSVQMKVDAIDVGTLVFDIIVELELSNVILEMKNACITRIKLGTLASKVDLKYKEFPLMAPVKKEFNLPGALVLPGGGLNLA